MYFKRNNAGRYLRQASVDNAAIYREVTASGVGSLHCLGCEVYGRWGKEVLELMAKLVREWARGLHKRIQRGAALGRRHRWWGILSMALHRSVAQAVLRDEGADLATTLLEPVIPLGDLPAEV